MNDLIMCFAVEKENLVTTFYGNNFLRASQERSKIVLKPRMGFTRFLQEKISNFQIDISHMSPKIHDGTSGSTQKTIPDFWNGGTLEETVPSQSHSSQLDPEAGEEKASTDEELNAIAEDIEYYFENGGENNPPAKDQQVIDPPIGSQVSDPSVQDNSVSNHSSDDLLEESWSEKNRSQPLETELNENTKMNKRKYGYFELDPITNSIEIFTETASRKYYVGKKMDNPELFEKDWMAKDEPGRSQQFQEIVKPKFDLFELIRSEKGGKLVFIPYEDVFNESQKIAVASEWKNAMGKDSKVPVPSPLCLIIFDKSKAISYTG